MALYREWRPKVFEDVIGQEHIVRTIKNQILQNRIPHAYLFCGTRGTGKTTTAKILSKAVNCLNPIDGDPCNECEICREINDGTLLDVIEIDAASNNRVENIRELIEDVKYPPHKSKYKVYIIDEVHMLSTSAFNALLKTLEEPPGFVIFILATTDPQKVPPTILSRCQRFDFKRIAAVDIRKRLRKIVDDNGAFVEDKTLDTISRVSDGAMRDAISILDQAISTTNGRIEHNDVISMLGLTSNENTFGLVDKMIDKDIEGSIKILNDIIQNGKDILQFAKDLTKHFRNLLMVKVSKSPEEIIDASDETINLIKDQAQKVRSEEIMRAINIIVEAENEAKLTSQPRILLEMAIIKFCKREYDASPEMLLSRINLLEERLNSGAITVTQTEAKGSYETTEAKSKAKKAVSNEEKGNASDTQVETKIPREPGIVTLNEVKASWHEVLTLIKSSKKVTVASWLSLGEVVDVSGDNIIINFDSQHVFSKNNLESPPEHKKMVEECFSRILNKNVRVTFKVHEEANDIDRSIQMVKELVGDNIVKVIE
jgi:DNA polymerase-3 subunit gamma/tau